MSKRSPAPRGSGKPSDITREKASATKDYIEKKYEDMMAKIEERKTRRRVLDEKLREMEINPKDKKEIVRELDDVEKKERFSERRRMGPDDFETRIDTHTYEHMNMSGM
jgi:serine/threonine kinase 38